jgi:hypothetical protein
MLVKGAQTNTSEKLLHAENEMDAIPQAKEHGTKIRQK